jgi:predicted nucleotidyltransferase
MNNRPIRNVTELNPLMPQSVASKLEDFARKIDIIAKDNLMAVYLYGSVTHQIFDHPQSSISVLIVLKSAKIEDIENISPVLYKAQKDFQLEATIITREETKTSADVFPIEFTDMKVKKFLLIGEDVFKNVHISMEDLRLSCELELKKRIFSLRRFFVLNLKHPKLLMENLIADFPSFLMQVDTVLYLKAGRFATSTEELLKEVYKELHIQNTTLKKIHEMSKKRQDALTDMLEIIDLYNDYLAVVSKMATLTDGLEVYKNHLQ